MSQETNKLIAKHVYNHSIDDQKDTYFINSTWNIIPNYCFSLELASDAMKTAGTKGYEVRYDSNGDYIVTPYGHNGRNIEATRVSKYLPEAMCLSILAFLGVRP